jgi:DNA-binding CsgD family transcriptional regulator
MRDLLWDKRMLGAFIEQSCLTEEEIIVLKDMAFGKSIANTAMTHNMSEGKVSEIRKRLRIKYDRVQPYTKELPPRIK